MYRDNVKRLVIEYREYKEGNMPTDIDDGVVKIVFRFVIYLIKEILYEILCYQVGKYTVLMLTLGTRPQDPREHENVLAILGCVVLMGISFALIRF